MKAAESYKIKIAPDHLSPADARVFLLVDLSGQSLKFSLCRKGPSEAKLVTTEEFSKDRAKDVEQLLSDFLLAQTDTKVDCAYIIIPGPVLDGVGHSARLNLTLSETQLQQTHNISKVFLINDLEAMAYGIGDLTSQHIIALNQPVGKARGNMAILAPGDGLGEAGLFFDGEQMRPFASEGGHSEFSPRTNVEVEFYQFLHKIYGIVSWENVLSFDGIFNIFRFLRDEKRHPVAASLKINFASHRAFTDELVRCALEDKEMIATITINTFLEFLAREANSLVLKLKATGGLYLAGDILVMLKDYIDGERFYHKFLISDKMENLLRNTPISLVYDADLVQLGFLKLISNTTN